MEKTTTNTKVGGDVLDAPQKGDVLDAPQKGDVLDAPQKSDVLDAPKKQKARTDKTVSP